MSEPTAEFETVTPAKARKWMARNESNRKMRRAKVRDLVRDIRAGQWLVTGDAVKFDSGGRLVDGQHRLQAVADCGIAIRSLVVRGLDPMAVVALDTGSRRSGADQLVIAGIVKPSAAGLLAAAVKFYAQLHDGPKALCNPGFKVPHWARMEIASYRAEHLLPWCDIISRRPFARVRMGAAGGYVALAYITDIVDPELARSFWDKVTTGAGLEVGDPEYVLREAFGRIRVEKVRHPRGTYIAMAIKAWNARRAGTKMARLGWSAEKERYPEVSGWPWPGIDIVKQVEDHAWDRREANQ